MSERLTKDTLVANLMDARARTIELVHGLDDDQLMGPGLGIVNPLLWEIGHLAWFYEYFVLRRIDGKDPILPHTDKLYDSMKVHHDTRWDLELPDLHGTFQYMRAVEDAMIERLGDGEVSEDETYLYQLSVFHEDMHDEALLIRVRRLDTQRPNSGQNVINPPRRREHIRETRKYRVATSRWDRDPVVSLSLITKNGRMRWRSSRSKSRKRR